MKDIYLDHAAATPILSVSATAMSEAAQGLYANPSALHGAAIESKEALSNFRNRASAILSTKPNEIIFTAGATEANNIFISGALKLHKNANVLVSPFEHDAVATIPGVKPWSSVNGLTASVADIVTAADDNTVAISCILVNNETGTLHDLRAVVDAAKQIREDRQNKGIKTPCYVHVDAAQAFTTLRIRPKDLSIDALTCNGGKLGGPKQSGCLFISRTTKIKPITHGGGQERGLRPGTEALHQIAGFVAALEYAQENAPNEHDRLVKLRDCFESKLSELGGQIVADNQPRSPHVSAVLFPGYDNETLALKLSDKGIYVGVGSACHAGSGDSRVLGALGYSQKDAQSVLRFSYGYTTSRDDLDYTAQALVELL